MVSTLPEALLPVQSPKVAESDLGLLDTIRPSFLWSKHQARFWAIDGFGHRQSIDTGIWIESGRLDSLQPTL